MAGSDSSIRARWRRATTTALLTGTFLIPGVGVAQAPTAAVPTATYSFLACAPVTDDTPLAEQAFLILEQCQREVTQASTPASGVMHPEPVPTPLTPLQTCTAQLFILDPTAVLPQWTQRVPPVADPVVPPAPVPDPLPAPLK